jgi:WD40 repeat protein
MIRRFTGFFARDLAATLSPDGRRAVLLGPDAALQILELGTGQQEPRTPRLGHVATALALSADGTRIVYPDRNFVLTVYNTQRVNDLRMLRGHNAEVVALTVSADGGHVLSASKDGTARIWSLVDGRMIRRFTGFFARDLAATLSPDGRFAAILSAPPMPYLLLWDIAQDCSLGYLNPADGQPLTAAYLSRGARLALTVDRNNWSRLWDISKGRELARLAGNYPVAAAQFTDETLVTIDPSGTVRRYRLP